MINNETNETLKEISFKTRDDLIKFENEFFINCVDDVLKNYQ